MIYEAAVGGGWADCLWLPARTGFFLALYPKIF
jgi:hypothetical protein